MTTRIVASTMPRARQIAADRGWPRSAWTHTTSHRAIRPGDDIWLDPTGYDLPGIADAVSAILNPVPARGGAPSNLPRLRAKGASA